MFDFTAVLCEVDFHIDAVAVMLRGGILDALAFIFSNENNNKVLVSGTFFVFVIRHDFQHAAALLGIIFCKEMEEKEWSGQNGMEGFVSGLMDVIVV